MITLYDNDTGAAVGRITDAQLAFMVAQLEEESADDRDYYLTRDTLELLEQRGAEPTLLDALRGALGDRDDIEIRWDAEP
jgi:processive 1,2-diacylglycerol beta-glucosyltransferase